MTSPVNPPTVKSSALAFFFGGLLPVIAFTVIEEMYGPYWGTVAGIVFSCGEMFYEKLKFGKVSKMTLVGSLLIIVLGGVSLISQDGIWFKLQPAILEILFAFFFWGSVLLKKNFLVAMAEKQGNPVPDIAKPFFNGISIRIGFFFSFHAVLATWAAFAWSTAAWAVLKGVGLTVSFVAYILLEVMFLRARLIGIRNQNSEATPQKEKG